jgi:hypothetical protein
MMQNELQTKVNYAEVGEAISHDLAAKMVKNYQDLRPNDTEFFFIGRTIIDQILSQPDCVGIRFYNAINEDGAQTLVYVGYDVNGQALVEYTTVNGNGQLSRLPAIVADRSVGGTDTTTTTSWFGTK